MKRRILGSKVAEYYDEESYEPTQEEVDNYRGEPIDLSDPDDYAIFDEEAEKHLDENYPKNHSIYGIRGVREKQTEFFYVGENGKVYETKIVHPTHAKEHPAYFLPDKTMRYTWEDAKFRLLTLKHMSDDPGHKYAGIQWFITHN